LGGSLKPMGNLWRCCAGTREPIGLLFGLMSGVGPIMGVLDGIQITRGVGKGQF